MKLTKRILSMLLCVVMVVGMIPATTLTATAAGETTYVLSASDFQAKKGHDAGAQIVSGILDQIDNTYTTMDGFLFAGDYDVNYSSSASGKTKLQQTVQGVYGTGMHEVYTEGNHDDNGDGSWTSSGANDAEAYGVFVINEDDYMWYNNDEARIQQTANNLQSYLNAKRNAQYTKPIFVISHLPLHYCMRTREGGNDGMHANYIFDVLNEAGNAGLNIIFLFGHNHSHGWDDYLGGAAIYLKKGDKINIAQNSTTVFQEETLAFTYMNPGYVGYYGDSYNSNVDKTLTMSVFEITDDEVKVSRYDSNGLHNMKSAGEYNVEYPDSAYYSTNETVYTSPQTITLNKTIEPVGSEITPPTTPDVGGTTTERTYTRVTSTSQLVSGDKYLIIENGDTDYFMLPESITNSAGNRTGYNIEATSVAGGDTITGDYEAKEWTMTGSGTSWKLSAEAGNAYMTYQDSSRAKGTFSSNNSSTFTLGGSADNFTFSTRANSITYGLDHSSEGLINGYRSANDTKFYIYRMTDEGGSTVTGPTVETSGGDWVTITEPTEGTPAVPGREETTYTYTRVTSISSNKAYVILAEGDDIALMNNNNSKGTQEVNSSDNGATITSTKALTEWTFSSTSSGTSRGTLYDQDGSRYLYLRDRNSNLNLSTSSTTWTFSNQGNGNFQIYRSFSQGNKTYTRYIYFDGDSFEKSNSVKNVRLYEYTSKKNEIVGGTPAVPGEDGLYAKIEGELSYDVAYGASREEALAAVKAGITGVTLGAASKPGANATGTALDDSQLVWTLADSYDGTKAGEYAVTISYEGKELATAKVVVPEGPTVAITDYVVEPAVATVRQGANATVDTGSQVIVFLEDDTYYRVPVTLSMLSKDGKSVSTAEPGTYEGLTVTYNGIPVFTNFTLHVTEKAQNHYPEYPNEGAVKVNKTAQGINFQATGVAQVELSASGVPAQKGVDVVVVIDTSSSMTTVVSGSSKSRIQVLSESLEKMLTAFQTPNDSGITPDIDISIIEFNGYLLASNDVRDFDKISLLDNNNRTDPDLGRLHTRVDSNGNITTANTNGITFTANDFVNASALNASAIASHFTTGNCASGTNYDIALQNAYDLLAVKKEANDEEEREQYVIFMSDGAPFRYNGFNNSDNSNNSYTLWNQFLSGDFADADAIRAADYNEDYLEFYNGNGTNHPHRYAEAIKGEPGSYYMVPHRSEAANGYQKTVEGLGATVFSIGFCLAPDQEKITVETMAELITAISSGDRYSYPDVQTATELDTAFTQISTSIAYAATEARFVDQLGDNYNLQFAPITDASGKPYMVNGQQLRPSVEIKAYDIYTRAEHKADSTAVPENMIGVRKGTSRTLETITFDTDASGKLIAAYSDQFYTLNGSEKVYTNILGENGVIDAQYFLYNTGNTAVAVEGVKIPTANGSSNLLPSETFYWKMDTVQTQELAMSYYVYLTGSMEGTRPAGSYPTNNYAILYYTNYLDKEDCFKETTSPAMAWKSANVSYAFYLVNKNGQIIVNQTTGAVGSFANRIAVTQPVVYSEVYLNASEYVQALNVQAISEDVLPEYYSLYDEKAVYTVKIRSDGTGSWAIEHSQPIQSTYVTQFDTTDQAAFSNLTANSANNVDYTHTVVWFAIVWELQAHPDAVVVDYGLPVDISVLQNDMLSTDSDLEAVGPYTEELTTITGGAALPTGFGDSFTGTYGTATVNKGTNKLCYTLTTTEMDSVDQFTYAVRYNGEVNSGYYYDHVTVIPATTVYYEETFLQFENSSAVWEDTTANYDASGFRQDEDRPGFYSIQDANNPYGYDSHLSGFATFSLGNAKKVHVSQDTYARASFSFIGTGFDILGMTANTTGVLAVQVTDAAGNTVEARVVDTYYGYTYEQRDVVYQLRLDEQGNRVWVKTKILETASAALTLLPDVNSYAINDTVTILENAWVTTPDQESALYQVPVLTSCGLTYGKYTVTLTATYAPVLDLTGKGGYDLYLDAVRIYDPAGTRYGTDDSQGDLIHSDIQDAYRADNEARPVYYNIRNLILKAGSFNMGTAVNGIVFIDGRPALSNREIADYESYGPNNEVYLAPGQSIAFQLTDTTSDTIDTVQIGISSADGKKAYSTLSNVGTDGKPYNSKAREFSTTTDMFYSITDWKDDIIVLSNTGAEGDGILSLTNIKITHKEAAANEVRFRMTSGVATLALQALNTMTPFEDTTVGSPMVTVGAAIVRQPESISVSTGTIAHFSVTAAGEPVAYQWQYRKLHSWFNTEMAGNDTSVLSVDAIGTRNGYSYRCIITYADGTVLTSDAATLRVSANLEITYHPKDQVVAAGDKAQFTAAAQGEGVKYQWQYCRPGSNAWIDTAMEGANKPTVLVETTTARNGYQYRCQITDAAGNNSYTEAATLQVLSLEAQPQNVTAAAGATAQFSVCANTEQGVTYRWQYSRDGINWYNTTMAGYNTDTLTVAVTAARNGYLYRCIVTGSKSSSITSDAAMLELPKQISNQEEAGA